MFRKWLVAVMAAAFMAGALVGCEPAEEPEPGPGVKSEAPAPKSEAPAPKTEAPAPKTEAEG
jgi:hypothetical protein